LSRLVAILEFPMYTPAFLVALPDVNVQPGFTRSVHAVVTGRDGHVDADMYEQHYDFNGEAGRALEARVSVHVKQEEIVDMGDGRYALDVIHFDDRPIAIVNESGYDSFDHQIVVLDMEAVDELLEAVRALLIPKVDLTVETGMDVDVTSVLKLKPAAKPEATMTP
jgi:hypothetical protein